MKINIYYGGRGLVDDPTLYVLNIMQEVLIELRVVVTRYNIYEHKNSISTLPQTIKDADGIILATTVEWLGIGGYMQQFLDACWLYGDKEKFMATYMQPIVMSNTYGEREGAMTLENAWELLGGLPCSGLCGYIEDLLRFELNRDYTLIIEKTAERLFRTISQRLKSLPTSNHAVKRTVLRTRQPEMTPQESEQLSKYVADDAYVKRQKEDIEELAGMFKGMMGQSNVDENTAYINELKAHFVPQEDFEASYLFMLEGKEKPLTVSILKSGLDCHYGQDRQVDVYTKMSTEVLDSIIKGQMTFQRAFMTGEMTAKGNFKTLRMLDHVFIFDA